jgi:hypothetical protein
MMVDIQGTGVRMPQETPFTADHRLAVDEATQAIQALLSDQAASTPSDIQALINRAADGAQHNAPSYPDPFNDPRIVAWALGAWWGNTLSSDLGWQWIGVRHGHWEGLGLCDPERRYLAVPFDLLTRIAVEGNDETPGPYARYNAIQAYMRGEVHPLPQADAGALMVVTN